MPTIINRKIEIDSITSLGIKNYEDKKFDSAFYYFNMAKLNCDVKKEVHKYVWLLSNMADIQQNQGDYSGSEETITDALPYIKEIKNVKISWNVYTIMGNNYLQTYEYDNALHYYNKALNLDTDELRKIRIRNNIALIFEAKREYYNAIKILYPLILRKEVINDSTTFSRISDNLGFYYYKTGNSEASKYLLTSMKIRKKLKDDWGLIASYTHQSLYHSKDSKLSVYYAKMAYDKATKLKSIDDRLFNLDLLINNSNGPQLKKYALNYIKINDSITKIRQQAKNQFAKMKYDSKKEKEENLNLKAQKAENALQLQLQKNTTLNLYFIVGILIATSSFIYFYLVEKSKRAKIKISYNTEVRIAKKLHDELANDVYQTMAFAEAHDLSSSYHKETLLDNLDTIYSRTRNISKENSTIAMGPDFIPNLKEMMSGFDTNSVNILIHGIDTIHWHAVEDIKKITVYRVLQELLINMKKHSESTVVVLSFKQYEKNLCIDYSDNGIGSAIEQLNLKNGLQNVENRLLAIKGTITFDSTLGKGFKSRIIFPL